MAVEFEGVLKFYLTYGLAAWGQACKTYLNKILILQKRALRLLYFANWHDHAIPLFLEANVLPITFLYLYYESISALMHDINNDKAPVNMSNLFQKTSNIQSYNTRSSTSGKFYVKSSRLEIQNNSFVRKTLFTFVPDSSNNIIYVREHKLRRENCIAS